MPIEVYDFHNLEDHTHVLVTPQIRARLLRIAGWICVGLGAIGAVLPGYLHRCIR